MADPIPATMRQWIMKSRPTGPVVEDNFEMVEVPVPPIGDGQVLLKVQYLGVAPAMARYMTNETSFEPPMEIGDYMRGRGVGRVVKSHHPVYQVGDYVQCKLGWREYAVIDDTMNAIPFKMDHTHDLPISHGCSALSMAGFTALIGIRDIGKAKPGDRVLVSGAAGGVGSQVAFVAKALGSGPVIGIAGGPEKCRRLIEEMGYDAAIDYKNENVAARLDELMPEGVDLFFDNVGGELLDEVMGRIRRRARITICGRISEYLKSPDEYHRHRNLYRIGLMDAKLEGFFIFDMENQYRECEGVIADWIRQGKFHPVEDIMDGLDNMPKALISLYDGTNCGVRFVRIDPHADQQYRSV